MTVIYLAPDNKQPIEKQEPEDTYGLDVHSVFPTIQGEGPFVGQPAIFVRLAGCNLRCPRCDTDYTEGRHRESVYWIYDQILSHAPLITRPYSPLIVITGGEPFRQAIGPLVTLLISKGYRVQIETNGTLFQSGMPWHRSELTVVCSPKAGILNTQLIPHIQALKYVITTGDVDPTDGLPIHALDHPVGRRVARPPAGFLRQNIYVQPSDLGDRTINSANLQTAINTCMQYGYTLCLQTHKIINLP